MRYITIIFKTVTLLLLLNQCTDKYYLDDKYADSYKSYGENILAGMQEYYSYMFIYPQNIDNIIRYTYDKYTNYVGFYEKQIAFLTNLTRNCKYTQEEREKTFFGFAAFNFTCMYKDYISIKIYDDSITVSCDIDNRNIFNAVSFKQDKCSERYNNDRLQHIYDNCILLDSTEYTVTKNIGFRDSVVNELYSIARKNCSEGIIVHKEDRDYWKVAILSYKRNFGLSSLCPDDIDLINDPYITAVKNFLDDLLTDNSDIYEIIIPVFCCE